MGVVNLFDKVCDRELQLVRPESARLVLGREAMAHAEIEEDVRGLADQEPASLQKWRRERRRFLALTFEQRHDRIVAALPPDVHVIGPCLLEREPDVFAASLDLRPVVELIAHDGSPYHRTGGRSPRNTNRSVNRVSDGEMLVLSITPPLRRWLHHVRDAASVYPDVAITR